MLLGLLSVVHINAGRWTTPTTRVHIGRVAWLVEEYLTTLLKLLALLLKE